MLRRAIALAALAAACLTPAFATEPARVLYFNEAGPRVDAALAKLRAAVEASAWSRRRPVLVRHIVVDHTDPALAERMREAIAAHRPAAIIAPSAIATLSARLATQEVPILFGSHQDPVALGLVRSMDKPGGNLTGFTQYAPIEEKRLELLREVVPGLARLGVIVDKWWHYDPASARFDQVARERFALRLLYVDAPSLETLRERLAAGAAEGVDAWYVTTSVAFADPEAAAKVINATRKPALYTLGMAVDRGGLMSYEARLGDPFAEWARLLGMVLDGAPAGSIPVAGPQIFEIRVNVATARETGITLPRSVLIRAEQVGAGR